MLTNWNIFKHIKNTFWEAQNKYKEDYKFMPNGAIFFSAYDVINSHIEELDPNALAEKMVATHTNPSDKYYGMTKEQILTQWSTSNSNSLKTGNGLDAYITAKFQGKPLPDIDKSLSIEQFEREVKLRNQADIFYDKFSKNPDYEFIGAGIWVNNLPFGFRGIIDLLFKNIKTNKLLILDVKQNKTIDAVNSFGKKMKGCLSTVPQTDLNKMTLQLFPYKYALEAIGYEVGAIALAHFKEDSFDLVRPQIVYDANLVEHIFQATRRWKVAKIEKLNAEKAQDDNNAIGDHERPKF